jgi:hypothetical protein
MRRRAGREMDAMRPEVAQAGDRRRSSRHPACVPGPKPSRAARGNRRGRPRRAGRRRGPESPGTGGHGCMGGGRRGGSGSRGGVCAAARPSPDRSRQRRGWCRGGERERERLRVRAREQGVRRGDVLQERHADGVVGRRRRVGQHDRDPAKLSKPARGSVRPMAQIEARDSDTRTAPPPNAARGDGAVGEAVGYGVVVESVNVRVFEYAPVRSGSVDPMCCRNETVTASFAVGPA